MNHLYFAAAVLLAYLLGSLSFAVIVTRLMGLADPRDYGSKNPGATNVLRSGNRVAAILTLLLDGFKGWLPVVLVNWYGQDYGLGDAAVAAVALAAFVGHLFPVFFGFKGGKGVATAAGVLLGLHWLLGLAVMAMFLVIAGISRYVSLASISAAILAPLFYVMGDGIEWYVDRSILLVIFLMGLMLVIRHRQNIVKLVRGTESRLGASRQSEK